MYAAIVVSSLTCHNVHCDTIKYVYTCYKHLILSHSPDALTVTVVSTSTTSLTISWTLADDVTVTEYIISYSNTDCLNDMYDDITGISDSETMYTLDDLEEGTEYSITVTAILSDDGVSAPESVTANTMSVG